MVLQEPVFKVIAAAARRQADSSQDLSPFHVGGSTQIQEFLDQRRSPQWHEACTYSGEQQVYLRHLERHLGDTKNKLWQRNGNSSIAAVLGFEQSGQHVCVIMNKKTYNVNRRFTDLF